MASKIQTIADIITEAAGWKHAEPDQAGAFSFSLDGGLNFSLFTPENRTAVLFADLGAAPEIGTQGGDEEFRRLSSVAAAALKKRFSIFSVDSGRMELHRMFPIDGWTEKDVILEVRDFLNDLAWWKQQLSGGGTQTSSFTSSPTFSFNMGGWFPGVDFR